MSEVPDKSKQEFIPDSDALQAVERIVSAHFELSAAKEALRGLSPDSLRAAFVLAEHVNDVGYQSENTDEIDEAHRRTIMKAAKDASGTAREAIRRNAAGVSRYDSDRPSLDHYDNETLVSMRDASQDVEAFALRFSPSDVAKSIFRR